MGNLKSGISNGAWQEINENVESIQIHINNITKRHVQKKILTKDYLVFLENLRNNIQEEINTTNHRYNE